MPNGLHAGALGDYDEVKAAAKKSREDAKKAASAAHRACYVATRGQTSHDAANSRSECDKKFQRAIADAETVYKVQCGLFDQWLKAGLLTKKPEPPAPEKQLPASLKQPAKNPPVKKPEPAKQSASGRMRIKEF